MAIGCAWDGGTHADGLGGGRGVGKVGAVAAEEMAQGRRHCLVEHERPGREEEHLHELVALGRHRDGRHHCARAHTHTHARTHGTTHDT
jgi:hypothetical protein